ncbi:MAG: hypothetical protein GC202_13205 [Alphaproteobacteria bacterium]|nr:hypothetical protein [Alphaproteobacteria bacterium]
MKAKVACIFALSAGLLAACGSDEPLRGPVPALLKAIDRMSDQDFAVPLEGGQSALLPMYSEKKLVGAHAGVKRVVVGIQDPYRNAGLVFDVLKKAVGEGPDTMVVVPQFIAAQDAEKHKLGPEFARWTIEGWSDGGNSRPANLRDTGPMVSSFTVLDAVILYLADRAGFPDLKDIEIVGYGRSGRMVQLYAAVTKGLGAAYTLDIKVHFVVANADTFVYFDDRRPSRGDTPFAPFEREQCPGFNLWPYGLAVPSVYAYGVIGADLARQYADRDVVYLIDERDTDPVDRDCEARAQGRNRLDRAQNYLKYLEAVTGSAPAAQRIVVTRANPSGLSGLLAGACGKSVLAGGGC